MTVHVNTRYFAAGDGVSDDTAALQEAIDAAGPAGVVHVAAGDYRVAGPVAILPGQRNYGEGTIRRGDGHEGFLVSCSDTAGVSLSGVTFDGNATTATWQSMIRLVRATDWTIQGATFRNTSATNPAVELRGAVRCRITGNSFSGVGYGVILGLDYGVDDPCHDNAITGNTMTGIGRNGVFVTENIGTAVGSVYWRVKRTTISGNAISGCDDTAIETGSGAEGTTVTGNTIAGCTTGILVRDNRFTNVSGNTVVGGLSGIADTGLNASSTGVVVSGNQVWSCTGRGIFLNTGLDRVVADNIVGGVGAAGITVTGGQRVIVSSNVVRDSADHAIQIGAFDGGGPSQVTVSGNIAADSGTTPGGDTDGIVVMGPSDAVVLTGNRCYDSRTGPARTQRYGVHVLQATQVRLGADNHCQNNHAGQVVTSPGSTV